MNDSKLIEDIAGEKEKLKILIQGLEEELKKELKNVPEGTLRISNDRDKVRFYHCRDSEKGNGTYINKSQQDIICALAQKDYNKKLLAHAKEKYELLCKFEQKICSYNLDDIYMKMQSVRQQLVTPYRPTDEEFVKQWQQFKYKGKSFSEDLPEIFTERGERVRSKSEKILADKFYSMGVPYRYECPLKLKGYGTVYPDFTLLNCRTRQEYYLEHFGLMDDAEYSEKAVRKITSYEKNGIFLGDRLLVNFETTKTVLDMKNVEKLIVRYLM